MKRIVPGLLIAGLWLLLLLKGSYYLFSVLISIAVFFAADEYLRMADQRQHSIPERILLNLLMMLPVAGVGFAPKSAALAPLLVAAFIGLTCYFLYRYKDLPDSYGLFTKLVFGLLYIGGLGSHLILLRDMVDGGSWLVVCSAVTASSDSGAYFVGKKFGKRKLCPNISPNKTVEGAFGGIGAGVLVGCLFSWLLGLNAGPFFLLFCTLVLSVVGIAGDLTESIIKRGTGTKDSGKCLAGHGGLLDRADSLLFAVPVLYYMVIFLVVS